MRRPFRCSTRSARTTRACAAGAKAISAAAPASETAAGPFISSEELTVMQHTKPSARLRVVTVLVGALLLLNGAIAQAQSGRRIPKRPTSADPMPPKESAPPVAQPEEKKSDKPALTLLLAKHMNDFMFSSDIYLNIVMDGFLERVSKLKNVKVEPGGRDMNRKQAYDAAKAAADRYVVWFQLA